jgi:hypothetical protein
MGREVALMSAQIQDRVIYRQEDFVLAGANGSGLFHPSDHNLKLEPPHQTCWRGNTVEYSVHLGRLMIRSLWLNPRDPGSLPLLLFGAPYDPVSSTYNNCPEPVPFTGGILVARHFRKEHIQELGFPPAWKFEEVHELTFEDSWLVKETDRSELMAEYSKQDYRKTRPIEGVTDHLAWIEGCFDLSYMDLDEL